MEIRVLRYFLAVVREESITKASEVLHITQPTLSRQLAQLEEEVGVKLFERGNRKIRLTNEGILLRRRAEEIVELADITARELLEQEAQVEGVISVGSGELGSMEILAELCGTFRMKYPHVQFDIYTATADVVKERMERGIIDIGLLLEPVDMERFEFIRFAKKERWVVLMRADDPLAGLEYVTVKELKNLPMILPGHLSVQSELGSWFGDAFGNPDIAYTSNLTTNAAVFVEKGFGYAVVVEGSLPFCDRGKVVSRPLYPELSATTALAWKREQPFSKATEKFIEYSKRFLNMRKA